MNKLNNNKKTSRFRFNPSRFGFAIIMLSMLPACGSRPGLDTADAEIPLDAEILQDAGPADAVIPMPCGENSGLQPGSPWPMHMGCPERRNRSAAIGPAAPDKIKYFEGNDIYRIGDDPVIGADGTVYIGSFYPHFGEGSNFDPEYCVRQLHAFNPDGTEQWVFEVTADFEEGDEYYPGFGDPPRSIVLAEDRIYFRHGNDCGMRFVKPSVMAVDYEGNEIWNFPVRDTTNGITVDPAGSLYSIDIRKYNENNAKHLVSLTPDGIERWASPIVGSGAGYIYPLLCAEGRIFVGSRGIVFSFKSDDGDLAWQMEIGDYLTSAMSLGDNGIIYLTASVDKMNSLYALSPEGEILWSQPIGEGPFSRSLAVGPDGMIVVSIESNIFAFTSEGDLLWTYEEELGRYYVGPVIDGEGTIYANMNGTINAISHDGTLNWTTSETGLVFESGATPAIGADGALYIGCHSKLCVIEP